MSTEKISWSTRKIRRPGRPLVEWLRLGTLGNPEITVGVLKDGSWVVDTADGLADFDVAMALYVAFPILKCSINELQGRLAEFRMSSQNTILEEFPLSRLVVHAICSGGFWAEQSLAWLSEIELNACEIQAARDGLMAIENNKLCSQELRHKARHHRRQLL